MTFGISNIKECTVCSNLFQQISQIYFEMVVRQRRMHLVFKISDIPRESRYTYSKNVNDRNSYNKI